MNTKIDSINKSVNKITSLTSLSYFELQDFIDGLIHKLEVKHIFYCFNCRELIRAIETNEWEKHNSRCELKTWREVKPYLLSNGIEDPVLGIKYREVENDWKRK